MSKTFCSISCRLTYELSKDFDESTEMWLFNHLRRNGWNIASADAPSIAERLDLLVADDGYRDVHVTPPSVPFAARPAAPPGLRKDVPSGVQQKFLCYVQCRIKYELSQKFNALEESWIMNHLRRNDWIIRLIRSRKQCTSNLLLS